MVIMKLVCLVRLGHCARISSGEEYELSTGIPSSYVLSFCMNIGDITPKVLTRREHTFVKTECEAPINRNEPRLHFTDSEHFVSENAV